MSSCIYHDAEAVTICPSCDFGVCQPCMDEGQDGVCATCAEERRNRRAQSAVQREYETAVAVKRCSYCRAAEDDESPLDEEGYCANCAGLPRCTTHSDLVAVGHCKLCRQEYCRKCLGIKDICQACQANPPEVSKVAAASKAAARAGTARVGAERAQAKAGTAKTGNISRSAPTGRMPDLDEAPKRRKAASKGGSPAGADEPRRRRRKGGTGRLAGADDGTRRRKAPSKKSAGETPTSRKRRQSEVGARGAQKAASTAKSSKGAKSGALSAGGAPKKGKRLPGSGVPEGNSRRTLLIGGAVALVCVLCLVGLFRPPSDADYYERSRGQMLAVHQAVIRYFQKTQRLPSNENDLKVALGELPNPDARGVRLRFNVPPDGPGQIVYRSIGSGFEIKASAPQGGYLTYEGKVLSLDQYYDSGGTSSSGP